jgi:outer membrane translocation and assembly module TamA
VNQWVGTRSVLFASEARLFVAEDVGRLLSFALAAFAETGYAWPQGARVALRDLRSDVGLGLMIGRNRLTTRPLRVDVAYAFNPPPGRDRWQLSMGVQFSFVD